MKVLFIHTFYKLTGGEDHVFNLETDLISKKASVEKLCFYNTGSALSVALKFILAPWNFIAVNQFKQAIKNNRPDVVHIHNWYFAASPFIIREAKKAGIPVVVTLHNYRLLCPSATLYFNGEIYTKSLKGGFPWDAVFKKVYRNSLIQTFWLAFTVQFNKWLGTWKQVDYYIALTSFAKDLFVNANLDLPKNKIIIKPNFVPDRGFTITDRKSHFLFVGRLAEEKGIDLLLETFADTTNELVIIGDGPLKNKVLLAASEHPNIIYLGNKPSEEVTEQMKMCSALIFPSIWFEGMPMTILEAFSTGTPVIASDLGAMKSLIQNLDNGLLFEPKPHELRKALTLWQNLDEITRTNIYENSRKTYEKHFTEEKNADQLLAIYNTLLDHPNSRARLH